VPVWRDAGLRVVRMHGVDGFGGSGGLQIGRDHTGGRDFQGVA